MAGQHFPPPTNPITGHLAEGPLPPGWEMIFDRVTGWPYFVDHTTQRTSWEDPRKRMMNTNTSYVKEIPVIHESSTNPQYPQQPQAQQYPHHYPQPQYPHPQSQQTGQQHHQTYSQYPSQPHPSREPYMPQSQPHARNHSSYPVEPMSYPHSALPGEFQSHNQNISRSQTPPSGFSTPPGGRTPPRQGTPTHHLRREQTGSPSIVREIPIHHVGGPRDSYQHMRGSPQIHESEQGVAHPPHPATQYGDFQSAIPPSAQRHEPQPKPEARPQKTYVSERVIPIVHDRQRSGSEPHKVPDIPVSQPQENNTQKASDLSNQQQQECQQTEPVKPHPQEPPSALSIIERVLNEVKMLETKVGQFDGTQSSREYKYLEEMLTRNLITLDNVEADGDDNVRQARKQTVRLIQAILDQLELKGFACEQPSPPQEPNSNQKAESDSVCDNQLNHASTHGVVQEQNVVSGANSDKQIDNSELSGHVCDKKSKDPSKVKEMVLDSEVSC